MESRCDFRHRIRPVPFWSFCGPTGPERSESRLLCRVGRADVAQCSCNGLEWLGSYDLLIWRQIIYCMMQIIELSGKCLVHSDAANCVLAATAPWIHCRFRTEIQIHAFQLYMMLHSGPQQSSSGCGLIWVWCALCSVSSSGSLHIWTVRTLC